jgi:hypothetical protein
MSYEGDITETVQRCRLRSDHPPVLRHSWYPILKCRGVAGAIPLTLDKIKVNLDLYIFDILDLDVLLGYPLERLLNLSQGSLDENLREAVFTNSISFLENHSTKLAPEQNPLNVVMYTFPFVLSKPVLFEVAEFSSLEVYDLEETLHFREDKHLSSLSTEFEPFPTNPYYVVFDLDWKPTLIFHNECCGIDLWAMEFYEAPTLKFVEKDHIDEHESFILETPQVPCSQDITSESRLLCASCFS